MTSASFSNPLHGTLKSQGTPAKQNEALRIVEIASQIFEEVFGKKDAIHAKPLFLKNRTLTVTCSSAAMAQEIRANQGKIVARINEKLGKTEVDRIRYLA